MGKKTFNQTIDQLRFGTLSDELTDTLNEVVAAVAEAGKAGSVTLVLTFKPGSGGQIEVHDDIKMKLPKQSKGSSIMFVTPENNLQREDPRQRSIEGLRSVEQEARALKEAPAEEAKPLKNVG